MHSHPTCAHALNRDFSSWLASITQRGSGPGETAKSIGGFGSRTSCMRSDTPCFIAILSILMRPTDGVGNSQTRCPSHSMPLSVPRNRRTGFAQVGDWLRSSSTPPMNPCGATLRCARNTGQTLLPGGRTCWPRSTMHNPLTQATRGSRVNLFGFVWPTSTNVEPHVQRRTVEPKGGGVTRSGDSFTLAVAITWPPIPVFLECDRP